MATLRTVIVQSPTALRGRAPSGVGAGATEGGRSVRFVRFRGPDSRAARAQLRQLPRARAAFAQALRSHSLDGGRNSSTAIAA
jgi:hypothetical protein